MSHTPGATRAAHIILNGARTIPTAYGRKSAEGIADLIDRETAAPALLAACEGAFERLTDNDMIALGSYPLTVQLQSALAAAKGE